ncbi:MFS transporter [uncultured Propionibacterium sp.]|uniref:MFS transporter n=1 Tax=uncultured Propionibacterium sp. TaxID=218066 RepID=UPI00293195BF|nr:MFS transporter [uncultured Propionibacterium sp.]
MEFTRRLGRLGGHRDFRRLMIVRLAGQSGDGTAQVGMASYLLFDPQSQTSAWAVAGVLALTMLPYSLFGPFVSVLLDRFWRQRISVLVDLTRTACSLVLAAMIASHLTGGGASVVLAVLLLVMLSLNRFTLAGLQAGLAGTVDESEYLEASSIMPMIGPLAALFGGAAAGVIRLVLGGPLGTDAANGLIFVLAALLFIGAAGAAGRIPRDALGPEDGAERTTVGDVAHGLATGLRHLSARRPARLALLSEAVVRIGYGFLMAFVIVVHRHRFAGEGRLGTAIAGAGGWFAVSGVGFVLSGVVSVPIADRIGVRRCIGAMLLVMALSQATVGAVMAVPALLVNSFLIGLAGQSLKVQVDTVVQAHVDDDHRGRVFTLYDVLYNVSTVLGAVIAASVLPADAASTSAMIGMGAGYLLAAAGFLAASRGPGDAVFNRGTRAGGAEDEQPSAGARA